MTFTIASGEATALLLVLLRTAGFVVAAPIFGHRAVPAVVKAGLAAAISVALAGHITVARSPMPFVLAAPVEVGIGLLLGYLLSLGFHAVEIVGRLIALQTGLSLGAAINPSDDAQGSSIDPLFAVLSGLTFLALNLHVAMVQALDHSYTPFPLGGGLSPGFLSFGAQLAALALELGIRIALPLALALLLVQVAMGLLARAIPQINIFMIGMPVTLLAGLVVLVGAMPVLSRGAQAIYGLLFNAVASGTLP